MAKLHELLAVQSILRMQAETTRNDLKNTFDKKRSHFSELVETYKPLAEGEPAKVDTKLTIQTTVLKELAWISTYIAKAIDIGHQVDTANMLSRADIMLEDDTALLKGIPATSLLQLEKRIEEVQDLVKAIPTLDPTKGFTPDTNRASEGIYAARDVTRQRTEKTFKFVVMVGPTEKHPAQIKELNPDTPVGELVIQEWSSLITVAEKGDMLDRVESLLRAVKKARSKANETEVDVKDNRIGETILNYIFYGRKE